MYNRILILTPMEPLYVELKLQKNQEYTLLYIKYPTTLRRDLRAFRENVKL